MFISFDKINNNNIRYSVGGYHRSLSRSKPGFESLYRNLLLFAFYCSQQTIMNTHHHDNRYHAIYLIILLAVTNHCWLLVLELR